LLQTFQRPAPALSIFTVVDVRQHLAQIRWVRPDEER
jgi:hypothetical protein